MTRRPTMYDVADRAGVSSATVSFAFAQPHRVKPATLERVLAVADALGYVPSGNARGLALGTTGAIGLYSFDYQVAEPPDGGRSLEAAWRLFPLYVDEVQRGVEIECRQLGYALMVSGAKTHPSTPGVVDIAGRVEGLIALAGSLSADAVTTVSRRIPLVVLGSEVHGPRLGTVRVDDAGGMRAVVEHLLQVHGRRRLVFVGEGQTEEIRARYRSFSDVLHEARLAVAPPLPSRPGVDETTTRAVRAWLDAEGVPDAFVCATDQEALVTLDVLASAGVAVPAEVAVTGFDGIVAGRLSRPTLTTVRQPMIEVGRAAVRLLSAFINEGTGEPPPILGVEFLPGGSCGCGTADG